MGALIGLPSATAGPAHGSGANQWLAGKNTSKDADAAGFVALLDEGAACLLDGLHRLIEPRLERIPFPFAPADGHLPLVALRLFQLRWLLTVTADEIMGRGDDLGVDGPNLSSKGRAASSPK